MHLYSLLPLMLAHSETLLKLPEEGATYMKVLVRQCQCTEQQVVRAIKAEDEGDAKRCQGNHHEARLNGLAVNSR